MRLYCYQLHRSWYLLLARHYFSFFRRSINFILSESGVWFENQGNLLKYTVTVTFHLAYYYNKDECFLFFIRSVNTILTRRVCCSNYMRHRRWFLQVSIFVLGWFTCIFTNNVRKLIKKYNNEIPESYIFPKNLTFFYYNAISKIFLFFLN